MGNLRSDSKKRERKNTTASYSCQTSVSAVPSAVPSESSKCNLFLNRISHEFVETLYTQMILLNLISHVNLKHLVYITADHLKTLKSPNEKKMVRTVIYLKSIISLCLL